MVLTGGRNLWNILCESLEVMGIACCGVGNDVANALRMDCVV